MVERGQKRAKNESRRSRSPGLPNWRATAPSLFLSDLEVVRVRFDDKISGISGGGSVAPHIIIVVIAIVPLSLRPRSERRRERGKEGERKRDDINFRSSPSFYRSFIRFSPSQVGCPSNF